MKVWTAVLLTLVTLVLGFFAASGNDDEFWEDAPADEQVPPGDAVRSAGRVALRPDAFKRLAIPKELPIGAEEWDVKSVDISTPAEEAGPPPAAAGPTADGSPVCCEHISIDITLERKPDRSKHAASAPRD